MSVLGQVLKPDIHYFRLNSADAHNGLYLDLDRVWDYNAYELSRWGAGLHYDMNFDTLSNLKCLTLGGYAGYGVADQRVKWGVKADLQGRSWRQPHVYLAFDHNLTQDAAHRLHTVSLMDLSLIDGFVARRFSETDRITLGFGWKASEQFSLAVEMRHSSERRLYDGGYLCYPASPEERDALPLYRLLEARMAFTYSHGWAAEVVAGSGNAVLFGRQDDYRPYARMLLQYDQRHRLVPCYLHVYAQCGATTRRLPYSRLFGLGGSRGSALALSSSMATVHIDEFAANLFAMASLKVGLLKPLFDTYSVLANIGMRPVPFVKAAAMWGRLWGQSDDGTLWHDELALMAPSKGLAEVGVGIDGLIRWGVVDWGIALLYRLTPAEVPYCFVNRSDNVMYHFTATINL